MNYGDPPDPNQGRAEVPGSSGGFGADAGPATPNGGAGAASGRASVGRASMGQSGMSDRPTGRASVPGGPPGGPGGPSWPGGPAGGANAGPATGRASVGRATVRPVSPGPYPGPLGDDVLEGPSGQRPPIMRPATKARAKKRRLRNWVIAGLAAFVMLAGAAIVGGTYVFANIEPPNKLPLEQSTTIFYADGVTPMAKVGDTNRTLIPFSDMPLQVQHAVVSAEDRTFYKNSGVDYKGIVRAAWNNVTGGERQGASTIAQQYARNVAKLKGITYTRKVQEAVMAVKLKSKLKPEKLMEYYLNTVYFGRGANGLEAAAQAYFGVPAKQLTVAQGIVLAGLIKQPGGKNGSPYDYTRNKESAIDRFNYVRDGMVGLGFLTKAEADALKYPTDTLRKYDPADPHLAAQYGIDTPTGFVVHHVLDELTHAKDVATNEPLFTPEDIKTSGYKIITTISKPMEDAAINYAWEGSKASPLYKQPANLNAALVAVEAGTGRVRAYYGGPKGSGLDMAGVYWDPVLGQKKENPDGTVDAVMSGSYHPPGSSFKVYTLGAALRDNISVDSWWDGKSPRKFPGRTEPIKNSGASCPGGCPLWQAVQNSMNTPMFAVTMKIGQQKVIEFARDAGIHSMWAGNDRIDLVNTKASEYSKYFGAEAGIGQYPITVLDHAAGVATVAARGLATKAHFVQAVKDGDQLKYGETINPKQIPGYNSGMADDEAWTLQQVMKIPANGKNNLSSNRQAAGKTGTWQRGLKGTENAHAWFVGFTASDPNKKATGLATAVWVGNKKDELALKDNRGNDIYGSSFPGDIWKRFMDAALKGTPQAQFAPAKHTGDATRGELPAPDPNAEPTQGPGQPGPPPPPCGIPVLCPPTPGPTKTRDPGGGGGGPPPPPQLPPPTKTKGH